MKKILLFVFAVTLMTSCGNSDDEEMTQVKTETPDPQKQNPIPQNPDDTIASRDSMIINMLPQTRAIELTQDQKAFVEKNNDFSFNLYRAINEADSKSSNITSPLSVTYVLGMLNDGAAGVTSKELTQLLGFGDNKQAVNEYCKSLIEQAPVADPSVVLKIANIVAANQNMTLLDAFCKDMQDYYSAEVASLDFSKTSSLDYLNSWCKEKSGGMIPSIIDELNPQDLLILMNAVYFNATWTEKFDEKDTKQEAFTKADGSKETIPMMQRKARIQYNESDMFTAISLPFGSGDKWSMRILLPKEGKTTTDVINCLNSDLWGKAFWQNAQVDIKVPRFTTKSDIVLNSMVAKLGAPSVFNPDAADFSLISKNQKGLFVSLLKQKAAIEVTEKGTKTTAVTVAEMMGADMVVDKGNFYADHPFVYIIQEASSGAIFFIGTFQGN